MILYKLDENHNPIKVNTIEEWKNEIVKQEVIEQFKISTIFIGMDHNFSFSGNPILFETMIFPINLSEEWEEYQERCSTWNEALIMHERAIQYLEEKGLIERGRKK